MQKPLRIAADIVPEREPADCAGNVVLVHGLAASRCDWVWLAPELNQAGYRTIALDLPGHGDSSKPRDEEAYTVGNLYTQFEAWLDSLAIQGPLVLVGHSLGGNLCLRYARRYPERLTGLVLFDPFYAMSQLGPLMQALFRHPHLAVRGLRAAPPWLVNALIGLDPLTINNFPPSVKQQISHDYLRASPHIMHLPPTSGDLYATLHEVTVETLVIWGERDVTLDPHSFTRLADRLPYAVRRSVPNCGHQPHLARPDLVNPWVLAFLQSLREARQA